MKTYNVTNKLTGALIYTYSAAAPIAWVGMEFVTHNHTEVVPEVVIPLAVNPNEWVITVGALFDRFGANKIPILASADLVIQAIIKDAMVRNTIRLHDKRAELSAAIDILISKGFAVDKAMILDTKPTTEELA